MATINGADLRRIFQFLDIAAADSGPEPFSLSTLMALADLIPAEEVSYFELRRKGREPGSSVAERSGAVVSHTTTNDPQGPPELEEALALYGHENPIGATVTAFRPADGPVRQSRVISRRELHRLGYYQEFYRPAGLCDTLKVWLHSSDSTVACIAFERTDGEFSDHDEAILGVLQSHLITLRADALARRRVGPDDGVRLTRREAEVLSWAVRGKRNEEIAGILVISPATVRKHLDHAYEKLGVHSRSEAAARLYRPSGAGD